MAGSDCGITIAVSKGVRCHIGNRLVFACGGSPINVPDDAKTNWGGVLLGVGGVIVGGILGAIGSTLFDDK